MPDPVSLLAQAFGTLGGTPGWVLGAIGVAMLFWALGRWSAKANPPAVARLAGTAAVLLAFSLLLRLGATLSEPQPLMPWWQWAAGLLVLPWLVRTRIGGPAAMLFFLCLSLALAHAVGWAADPRWVSLLVLIVGTLLQLAAVAVARLTPAPPAPEPVAAEVLAARLDSAEANEGADKYTRE